jgi:hypothetical protein
MVTTTPVLICNGNHAALIYDELVSCSISERARVLPASCFSYRKRDMLYRHRTSAMTKDTQVWMYVEPRICTVQTPSDRRVSSATGWIMISVAEVPLYTARASPLPLLFVTRSNTILDLSFISYTVIPAPEDIHNPASRSRSDPLRLYLP